MDNEDRVVSQKVEMSATIGAIIAALAVAQGTMKPAEKNKDNYYKKKYADLASVWDAIREPLSKNGLAIAQLIGTDEFYLTITTILGHSSGEYFKSFVRVKPKDAGEQASGIAITYWRRFTLAALIGGTAEEDNDGEHGDEEGKNKFNKAEQAAKAATKTEMDKLHEKDGQTAGTAIEGELGGARPMNAAQKTSLLKASGHKQFSAAERAGIEWVAKTDAISEIQASELLTLLRIGKCPDWVVECKRSLEDK